MSSLFAVAVGASCLGNALVGFFKYSLNPSLSMASAGLFLGTGWMIQHKRPKSLEITFAVSTGLALVSTVSSQTKYHPSAMAMSMIANASALYYAQQLFNIRAHVNGLQLL